MRFLPAVLALMLPVTAVVAADVPKVSASEAARLVADGKAVLVDVREPAEWKDTGVAAPAVLLPKSDFDGAQRQWKPFLAENRDKQIILYCRSGSRSGKVASQLAEQGLTVANAGAMKDWQAAGLPTRPYQPDAQAPAERK